ncbi:MAG: hypothetical protein AAF495_29585 [Pseudomonadota bacterium]
MIVEETDEGFYDRAAPACVADEAAALGCTVNRYACPPAEGQIALPEALVAAISQADHTVFFNRIGDQVRFQALPGASTKTMCYALDIGFLGAPFATLTHGLMTEVLARLEAAIAGARRWRVTCPRGSDASGELPAPAQDAPSTGFTLKLFPEVIFAPISSQSMSGRIRLGGWLMATANRRYQPDRLDLSAPVTALVEAGRITGFEGEAGQVDAVRRHYQMVAEKFEIDPWVVHSWHTGIHPKTFYPAPAVADLERWGAVAFASPRYTHFHTCGDYSPGEIAWSLFDATVSFDDEVFWQAGRFVFLERPEIRALIQEHGAPADAFAARRDIGI